MPKTVIATWVAREGHEDAVAELLRANSEASRAEPGCRDFTVLREVGEPRTFVLYEVYDDEAAFDAHRQSEHFKRYVLDDAVANGRLEQRFAKFYEPLEPLD
jgi:autoinducer 2-degrading protein